MADADGQHELGVCFPRAWDALFDYPRLRIGEPIDKAHFWKIRISAFPYEGLLLLVSGAAEQTGAGELRRIGNYSQSSRSLFLTDPTDRPETNESTCMQVKRADERTAARLESVISFLLFRSEGRWEENARYRISGRLDGEQRRASE